MLAFPRQPATSIYADAHSLDDVIAISRGIYECQYTIATTGEVVLTSAVLKPEEGSTTAGRVSCTPPVQDPTKTTKATWSASVGLVEGGFAVPRVNSAGEAVSAAPALLFASHGPVIAGIAEEIMYSLANLQVSFVVNREFFWGGPCPKCQNVHVF